MIFKAHYEKRGTITYHKTFLYAIPKLYQILPFDITTEAELYQISIDVPYLAIEMSISKNKKNRFCRPILLNTTRQFSSHEKTFVKTKCDEYFDNNPYILYNIQPLTRFV